MNPTSKIPVAVLGADDELRAVLAPPSAEPPRLLRLKGTDLTPAQAAENATRLACDIQAVCPDSQFEVLLAGLKRGDAAEVCGGEPQRLRMAGRGSVVLVLALILIGEVVFVLDEVVLGGPPSLGCEVGGFLRGVVGHLAGRRGRLRCRGLVRRRLVSDLRFARRADLHSRRPAGDRVSAVAAPGMRSRPQATRS